MNILFVCTGNTCRSSMAEGMLRDMLRKRGINGIDVSSAGIAAIPGTCASLNAIRVMQKRGIDLSGHIARRLDQDMLKKADLVLTMTEGHKIAIQAAEPSVWSKIYTLREYAGLEGMDIKDPYGGSEADYESCLSEIEQALGILVSKLGEEADGQR
ncbi:MAG TPA: low molecular weight protein arginine phosphatase [Candidatus Atribacteria bacterium]|nr:low molecular weight protein arginine phosphatase [Candidatus Atribacteria bacterium]HPT78553.1 low molecular weight protein arginine phosphatase [Candidatus Atribacteria bacterium]